MKEEKEKKVPSPMAILSGKSAPAKKSDKSDKKEPEKKKRKFKRTVVDHHEDGSQTANLEPSEAGGAAVSFSRPDLKSLLAGIQEHHDAEPEAEGQPSGPAMGA